MRSTEFVKITVVYGHIAENGLFVRNWSARKMAITDKMVKNGRLSVKIQPFRTRFYGQMTKNPCLSVNLPHNDQKFTDKSPKNDGLSVKCVLITDKSVKMGTLSVKFE